MSHQWDLLMSVWTVLTISICNNDLFYSSIILSFLKGQCNCRLCSVFLFLLNALLSAIFFFNDLAFYKQFLSITTEITTAVLDGKHETRLIMEPTRYFTDNLYILLFLPQMPILFASILITYCHSTLFDTIICITYVIVWNFHNFSVSYL